MKKESPFRQTAIEIDIDLVEDIIRTLNKIPMTKIEGLKTIRISHPDAKIIESKTSYDIVSILEKRYAEFKRATENEKK